MRVAVVGVGHYHALYSPHYLELLTRYGGELVGVSDPDATIAADRASRVGCAAFDDYRRMVEETEPDFVVALGRHVDMPDAFRYLVRSGVPFLAEKPWGVDPETVRELATLAEQKGAWVATPFCFRHTRWAEICRELVTGGEAAPVSHITFRMIRPGVARYIEQDSGWMLSKREAGGGVLLNLGVHGFDLCRYITGEEPEVVSAAVSNALFELDIEDYASVTLRTPKGVLFHVEAGYTYPTAVDNDDERKLAAAGRLVRDAEGGVQLIDAQSERFIPDPLGYLRQWDGVVADCLRRIESGQPPPNMPRDAARAVSLVFEAYRRAGVPG